MIIINKKEFKEAMLKGHGRCYLELKKNPLKYQDVILWACKNQISWDAQCSGTHSYYLYNLINCYEDKTPFINELIVEFKKVNDPSWKFLYLAEVLNNLALDGFIECDLALKDKYIELYNLLLNIKRIPKNKYFFKLENFEQLCMVLTIDASSYLKIANDIACLLKDNKLFYADNFEWFIASKSEDYEKDLIKASKGNNNLLFILNEYKKFQQKYDGYKKRLNKTNNNEIEDSVNEYLNAKDEESKIKALDYFKIYSYPNDPTPILSDAESDNIELKTAAIDALEEIRNIAVREWVLNKLNEDIYLYLPILLRNYESCDKKLLLGIFNNMEFTFDGQCQWHHVVCAIIDMKDYVLIPKEFLYMVYENSYCSECKAAAFIELKRRRLLTDIIKAEYKYDANDDISSL